MRVAVDATPLTLSSGGLARYTSELSRALAAEFPADEYFLLSDQPFGLPPASPPNLKAGPGPRGPLDRRWWLWGAEQAMRRCGAGVFHGTNFSVPYVPWRPSVLTLHDLSPWMDPGWHGGAQRVRRRTPLLIGLGLAAMIITDSEAVRRQAIAYFRLHPDCIVSVPLAAPEWLAPAPKPVERPYFLCLGTLEPRKNLSLLIRAWRPVYERRGVELVVAGRRRQDFPALGPEPGLHLVGEVRDEELPSLYSSAVAFVYPSLYEGFGLPVLEAMQCGAAVITSTDPAIAEVAGDAAIRLDPADVRAWTGALEACARDGEWLCVLREKALLRARQFTWRGTARLTRAVYAEAGERFGR